MSESVNINSLSLQQLSEIRKQLEGEVDHLSQSSLELRQVLGKYLDCSQSVKTTAEKANDNTEIMVPLTSSLYVPGRASNTDTFIVDIGTNYYVEKTAEEAVKFFDHKVDTLNKNLVDLERLLNEKVAMLRNMDGIYKEKFREELEKTNKEHA